MTRFKKRATDWAKRAAPAAPRKTESENYRFLNSLRETIGLDPVLEEHEDASRAFARPACEPQLRRWDIEQSTPTPRSVRS